MACRDRSTVLRRSSPILLLMLAAACGDAALTVRLSLHHDEVVNAPISVVPFDPDAILDSLASAAPEPAPTFAKLEEVLFAFEPSDDSALATINTPWLALRDSVASLSESLQTMDRTDPAYAAAYDRFRTQYARFTRRTAQRDQALANLDGNAVQLARWAQAAADTLRTWERGVFGAYDSLASHALLRSGLEAQTVNTDSHAAAQFTLTPGMWWLIVRLPDTKNPFLEYYWNIPVRVNGVVPTVLTLTERHMRHRWRH